MTDDQGSHSTAEPEQKEAILVVGVVIVRTQQSVVVEEGRPGFLEGDTVLPEIRRRLPRIPLEAKPFRSY